MIETVELTLSHVGLGDLNEFALLNLFASLQARVLTAGTGKTLSEIADKDGRGLYPAYYRTHLRVPANRPLARHQLWRPLRIGLEVRTFGRMLLESTCVAGFPEEVAEDPEQWTDSLPILDGSNMFIVEGEDEEQQVAVPAAGCVARLPSLTAPPESMDRFRRVRTEGSLDPGFDGPLRCEGSIPYPIVAGRDAAPGRNMVFSRFVEIMDHAEWTLLAERVRPGFPTALVACRQLLERETFYFGNCRSGEVVEAEIRGRLVVGPPEFHGPATAAISVGILSFFLELYQRGSNMLLAAARVRKLLKVPTARQSLLRDAERLLFQYGAEEEAAADSDPPSEGSPHGARTGDS